MRSKLFRTTVLIALSLWLIPVSLLAFQGGADDKKYAGTWTGTYTSSEGTSNALSYILRKDEKGQWAGTLKFTNQDGEQVAEFKSLQIADGKFSGKIDGPGGAEVTIQGQFQGDRLEGTYSVSPTGSTEVVDSGSWKLTRSAAKSSQ